MLSLPFMAYMRRTTIFSLLRAIKIRPWCGVVSLGLSNCPMPIQLTTTLSKKAKRENWSGIFITPFDYAGTEPARSIPSVLSENKKIGLCWAVIDFDDVNSPEKNGFWNLSSEHKMYGQADFLRSFRLMPLEEAVSKKRSWLPNGTSLFWIWTADW